MNYGLGIRTRILSMISYGLPVIVDNLSLAGFDKSLQNSKIFINLDDRLYFQKKLKKILENKKIYKSLSKQSFLTWEKKFNPEKNIKRINKIIFS